MYDRLVWKNLGEMVSTDLIHRQLEQQLIVAIIHQKTEGVGKKEVVDKAADLLRSELNRVLEAFDYALLSQIYDAGPCSSEVSPE